MITKAKYKICRRLGPGVYEKCQTAKFAASESRHSGRAGSKKKTLSEYGSQLIEKQKIRFAYGVSEKQFGNYVKHAVATEGTNTAQKLFQGLETRLDNVIYRLGLAGTRAFARQMVSHGHMMVNGKRVTVPSYSVKIGDVITIREGSKGKGLFAVLEARLKEYTAPAWLSWDAKGQTGKITAYPEGSDAFFDFNTVLEYYSR